MLEIPNTPSARRPWHLWVIGIVALIWSLIGVMDYLMTQSRNEQYMSQFTPEQLEYFYGIPWWMVSVWAISVWGGLLGAVLLLLRKRLAVWVFLVSLIGVVLNSLYSYSLPEGREIMGDAFSVLFTIVIALFSLGLFLYAKTLAKRNILV
jgi:uncharacterized membrane protein